MWCFYLHHSWGVLIRVSVSLLCQAQRWRLPLEAQPGVWHGPGAGCSLSSLVRAFTCIQFIFLCMNYPVQGREMMLVFLFWGTDNRKEPCYPTSLSFVGMWLLLTSGLGSNCRAGSPVVNPNPGVLKGISHPGHSQVVVEHPIIKWHLTLPDHTFIGNLKHRQVWEEALTVTQMPVLQCR